jgi:hypothetical protein
MIAFLASKLMQHISSSLALPLLPGFELELEEIFAQTIFMLLYWQEEAATATHLLDKAR